MRQLFLEHSNLAASIAVESIELVAVLRRLFIVPGAKVRHSAKRMGWVYRDFRAQPGVWL